MARILLDSTSQPVLSWIEMVLGVLVLSLLGVMMAKTKGGDGGEKERRKEEIAVGKRPVEGESSGAPQKKKSKTVSDHKERAQKRWEESMKGRSVICERQVDHHNVGRNTVTDSINRRGLHAFYDPVNGYIRPFVSSFYAFMKVLNVEKRIEAIVRGKKIVVTPDSIAAYLKFNRPTETTFPPVPYEPTFDLKAMKKDLLDNSQDYNGTFRVGKLTDEYRLLNKVVHFNIFPRGSEKKAGIKEAELMYAFLGTEEVIDVALWIWNEIVEFRTKASLKAALPYPHMITKCVWTPK